MKEGEDSTPKAPLCQFSFFKSKDALGSHLFTFSQEEQQN